MNALVQSKSSLPAPLPAKAQTAVSGFLSALEPRGLGFEIRAAAAPSPDQRAWLVTRCAALRASLAPISTAELASELAALFASLGHRNASEGEAGAILRLYASDLADLPAAALRLACADFRQGRAGDGNWAPTQAQLRSRANVRAAGIREELAQLERILNAHVIDVREDSAARERVMAHVRETVKILQADSEPRKAHRLPTQPEAEGWLAREKANPRPVPVISDGLAHTLGINRDGEGV